MPKRNNSACQSSTQTKGSPEATLHFIKIPQDYFLITRLTTFQFFIHTNQVRIFVTNIIKDTIFSIFFQ